MGPVGFDGLRRSVKPPKPGPATFEYFLYFILFILSRLYNFVYMSQPKKKGAAKPKARHQPGTPSAKMDILSRDLSKAQVSQEHIDAVMSMMDPGAFSSGTTRIPARGAWLRGVTTESIVHKLSTADGSVSGDGSFSLEARARPDGTLILRTGTALPATTQPVQGLYTVPNAAVSPVSPIQVQQVLLTQGGQSAGARLGTVAAGGTAWVTPFSCAAGGAITTIVNNPTISHKFRIIAYTGPIGALVNAAASNIGTVAASGVSNSTVVAAPALTTFLGVEYYFVSISDEGKKLQATMSITLAADSAVGAEARSINLTTLEDIQKLRAYRIVGQSLLLTYTGSQINNGGDIAIARVSSAWVPDPGQSVYDAILKLPKTRRMTGRVARGAHCYWVPETVEDFEPKLYGNGYNSIEKPSYKMVAAGTLDDPSESVLLQLETIVEFQTDAPSYASIEYAPPWSSFDVALLLLANLNPCDENPSHLKNIAKFLKPKVKAMLQYAIDNPGQVAATVGKILPLLL